MSTRGQVAQLREPVLTAALRILAAERGLPAPGAVRAVNAADDELVRAARAFVTAVDDLPPGEMPRTWRDDPERRSA